MTKEEYFSQERITITGNPDDEKGYIYQLGSDGIMFREAHINGNKKTHDKVEILLTADLHLNCLNARDCIEGLPCIKSTREFRHAFRDGRTVPNAVRTLDLAKYFDKTVIAGDTLDYITWGTIDLMNALIWEKVPDVLVSVGGHDITRVMEGKVADETTLESRYDILKSFWRHDVNFVTRVLKDSVRIIVLNNGEGKYFEKQAHMLRACIDDAKEKGHTVLIFQHEPICTRNPEETDVVPIRVNDGSGTRDFCTHFIGCNTSDTYTTEVYDLITKNADVVKGVFCGHWHSDFYTEIIGSYEKDGKIIEEKIPQYVLTGNMYDKGHAMIITIE